jgi:hypothetical protein
MNHLRDTDHNTAQHLQRRTIEVLKTRKNTLECAPVGDEDPHHIFPYLFTIISTGRFVHVMSSALFPGSFLIRDGIQQIPVCSIKIEYIVE